MRGCFRCYCSTDTSDLEHLVEHVIPSTCKLFIMGYSAGSNVAARFASYGKNRQRLLAVALVCTISKYQVLCRTPTAIPAGRKLTDVGKKQIVVRRRHGRF